MSKFYRNIILIILAIVLFIVLSKIYNYNDAQMFQKIVLIIAIIVLMVTLVFIGLTLENIKGDTWPPLVPECPDWFEIDNKDPNKKKCINVKNLGKCKPKPGEKHLVADFNAPIYQGQSGLCNKYKWATSCGVEWDGLTYGADNPCIQQAK